MGESEVTKTADRLSNGAKNICSVSCIHWATSLVIHPVNLFCTYKPYRTQSIWVTKNSTSPKVLSNWAKRR